MWSQQESVFYFAAMGNSIVKLQRQPSFVASGSFYIPGSLAALCPSWGSGREQTEGGIKSLQQGGFSSAERNSPEKGAAMSY